MDTVGGDRQRVTAMIRRQLGGLTQTELACRKGCGLVRAARRWGAGGRARVAMALVSIVLVLPPTASGASVEVSAAIGVDQVLDLGGLLPLGSLSCSLCANFVTTFDRDGTGTGAPVTRLHRDLLPNFTYQLDVDGSQPPKLLLLGADPVYELSARVEAVSADKATIMLRKLAAAPTTTPLRAEIVTGDVATASAGKTTFGYDTLDTTAPRSFAAAIDRSDRDGNASTENVFADLTIDGASLAGLAVVKEGFKGPLRAPAPIATSAV